MFENIAIKIIPDEPVEEEDKNAIAALDALDERLFTSPALALDQAKRVVEEMSDIAAHNFDAAVQQIYKYDSKRDARIETREDLLDSMTDATNKYLVSLSSNIHSAAETRAQNRIIKIMICYERIGDLAVNIANVVESLRAEGKEFSDTAMAELRVAFDAIYEIMDKTQRAFKADDSELAAKVEPLEEVIDDMVEELNARHVFRMVNQVCDPIKGIHFQSVLTNIEHISDKCSDIAVYVMESDNTEIFGKEHSYVHDMHHSNNKDYTRRYDKEHDKYFKALNEIPQSTEPIE